MSTIAQFRVPVESFALREALPRAPDVEVEVERVATHGEDRVLPFLWASGEGLEAFHDALVDDPTVDNVELLSDLEDGHFYQMEWVESVEMLLYAITEYEAAVLKARAADGSWSLRVVFPDRDSVGEVHEFAKQEAIPLDLDGIYQLEETKRYGQYGLSEAQYETLVTALDSGYYEVPRETATADLADRLDVSQQAVSERLRRGHGNLVDNALTVEDEAEVESGR